MLIFLESSSYQYLNLEWNGYSRHDNQKSHFSRIRNKKHIFIATVDESGLLKVFHRMDGAALISIEVAQIKAYSAVANTWGFATHEIFE